MKTILKARNIQKVFGTRGNVYRALEDINLEIQEGEFIGIMGPSGAGKSTLLNIFSTIDTPTAGEIMISEQNIVNMKEKELSDFRRDKLGFIFQDYNLLDTLTVKENILLPLALAKVSAAEIEKRVNDIAKTFGISDLLDKYPYHISGGQKQRTAAARAIIANPALVLADEPTGALDSKSAKSLLESLTKLNREREATIMMVTHDAFAASFCKRVLFIKDGSIAAGIYKGEKERQGFFEQILHVLASIGGGE
ncbi:ABC transporter ATP-binding protein [Priestia endophytica]|uniref:ABC transporter ATP-binding protein n=1 Tax=Priestia endophytica TaxID=135735 RepID=UPI002041BAD3|nr:ABC transporter ATP-binding protein [Priestia endophytica]MCM3537572.1 ABC transporter ATP-binding protein [Priestia endophytica]